MDMMLLVEESLVEEGGGAEDEGGGVEESEGGGALEDGRMVELDAGSVEDTTRLRLAKPLSILLDLVDGV